MKKLSAILSVIIATASINFTAVSAQNQTGDKVLYENNFNNGTSDIVAVSEEDFDLSVVLGNVKTNNGGIWRDNGADKQNFLFDFTKGGTVAGLNSGAYKISYDFTVNESAKYGDTITGVNMKNHWDGGRAFYIKSTGYDVMEHLYAYPSEYTKVVGAATLDMVIDFTSGKVKYYVNDENVGEQTNLANYTPVTNYSIALSDSVACFDNLKITRLSNETATVTVQEAYNGNGYIDVAFSNEIIKNAEFYVDGEKASEVLWLDDFTARIIFSEMLKVGVHTVSVKNGKDFLERTVSENEIEFNVLDSSKKNVLYENSFDNGTEDITAINTDYFNLSVVLGNVKAVNGGIWRDNGADKQNFLFDFTKGGTVAGLNSGTYKISYDFTVNESAKYGDTITGVNMKNHWDGGRAFYIKSTGYDVMEHLYAYPSEYTKVTGAATLDMVIDFTSGKVKYYINGENVGEQTNLANYTPVTNYSIALSDAVSCFDNLKITKIEADKYGITAGDTYDDCEYIDVKFTKDVLKTATFKIDETPVASENISWINANTARINVENGLAVGKHSVSADAKDFLGNAPAFNTAVFEVKNSSDKYILYKNSFDNGASDAKSIENEYFTLTVQSEEDYMPVDAEINGNKGVKLADNTTGADYSTFFFDFTKGGKTTGLSDGIYKISYDFAIDSEAPYEAYSGFNMSAEYKNVWEGNRAVYFSKDGYSIMSVLADWGKSYVAVDGVASMDILIDFTKNEVSYYVNGEFIKKQTNLADKKPIRNYSLAMSGAIGYLDNLSITKLEDGSFEVMGMEAVVGADKLTVYANEPFGSITTSDIVLTGANAVSIAHKTVASADIDKRYALEVSLDKEVADADVYNISLNNTAKNIMGNTVNQKKNNADTTARLIEIKQDTAEITYYNNSGLDMKPVLIIAEYDGEGRLTNTKVVTEYIVEGEIAQVVASGSTVKISATVKNGDKIFAWSGFESLIPLGNSTQK